MDPISLFIGGFWFFWVLVAIVLVFFSLWMFIHVLIRTFTMWPEESILNIIMIIFMWVVPVVSAIVYYFVCYRKSRVLAHQ